MSDYHLADVGRRVDDAVTALETVAAELEQLRRLVAQVVNVNGAVNVRVVNAVVTREDRP